MKKTVKISLIALISLILIVAIIMIINKKDEKVDNPTEPINPVVEASNNFEYKLVNSLKTDNKNTLISPLSIGFALCMVNEGASSNTKKEISELLGGYTLPNTIKIKDRLAIANSIFIRDEYKEKINVDYTNLLSNNYDAELKYDSFKNSSNVNKWINENTFGMIKEGIGEIDESTISILINTIALDMKWINTFDCGRTSKKQFTKYDDEKVDVEMMYSDYGNGYIESDDAVGIVRKYMYYDKTTGEELNKDENAIQFEYIAILPKGDINSYLSTFSKEKLTELLSNVEYPSEGLEIHVNLPRYTYDYEIKDFNGFLYNIGIKDAFSYEKADFSKMVNDQTTKLYIGDSIHKTHIELSESGTKAAAVTAFMMKNTAIIEDENTIKTVDFNKPFIYIIKDVNSSKLYFIGSVFEPNLWTDDSKSCIEK